MNVLTASPDSAALYPQDIKSIVYSDHSLTVILSPAYLYVVAPSCALTDAGTISSTMLAKDGTEALPCGSSVAPYITLSDTGATVICAVRLFESQSIDTFSRLTFSIINLKGTSVRSFNITAGESNFAMLSSTKAKFWSIIKAMYLPFMKASAFLMFASHATTAPSSSNILRTGTIVRPFIITGSLSNVISSPLNVTLMSD